MMMFARFVVLMALVAVGAWAAPSHVEAEVEPPAACIARAEAAMDSVEVPERLSQLVEQLRALNPLLKNFSLIKFADSANADLRLVETGLVKASEMEAIVELCASFVAKAYPSKASGEQVCDLEQYTNDYNVYEQYLVEAAKHADYDRKLGLAKLCVQF